MLDLTSEKINNNGDDGWLDLATSCGKDNVQEIIDIKERLKDAYLNYENIITQYGTKPLDSDFSANKKILKHYYSKAPTSLNNELLTKRNEHKLEQCPFCGRPCKPSILDHFMPEDHWPEFCIFPNNLVPQCDKCSTKKWSHYYSDGDNSVKYIHPKFYNLLSYLGIKVELNIDNQESVKKPSFSIEFTLLPGLSPAEKRRLALHIKYLSIENHIIEDITEKYLYWIRASERRKFYVPDSLNQRIKEHHTGGKVSRWDIALYLAMTDNQTLMNYFDSLDIETEEQENVEFEVLST